MNLEKLSDAEIDQLYAKTVQTRKPTDNLENLSDAEIDQLYNQTQAPQDYTLSQGLQDVVTGTREVLKGATAGLSEPVIAGGTALLQKATGDERALSDIYQQEIQAQEQRALPETKISGQIVGAVAPGSIPSQITKGAASLVPQATSTLGKIAAPATQAALSAGAEQTLIEAPKVITGGQSPEQAYENLKSAATFGGVLGAGTAGAIKGIEKAPELAKKTLGLIGGVKEETINKYLQNYDAIKAAPSKEQVIQQVDDLVEGLKSDVESKKIALDEAKNILKNSIQDTRFSMGETAADLRNKINLSNQKLEDAYKSTLGQLSEKANLQRIATDVEDSIGALKNKISEGSAKSYELLDNASSEGLTISKKQFIDTIDKEISKLKIGGATVGKTRTQAVEQLENLKNQLNDIQSPYGKRVDDLINGEVANMKSAISQSSAGGKAQFDSKGNFAGYEKTTFPKWFSEKGFSSKEEFLSAVNRGSGKVYEKIKKLAMDRLEKGYDDGMYGRSEPLEGFKDMSFMTDELDPKQVKQVIQALDDDINYAIGAGEYMQALDGAQARVRGALNEKLKMIPGYADQMKEVSEKTKLLAELNKKFKDPTATRSRLQNITKDAKQEDAKALEKLGDITGNNFRAEIKAARDTEGLLKNEPQLRGIKALLPDTKKINSLQKELQKVTDPRSRQAILSKATAGENKAVREALQVYNESRDLLSQVSGLKSEARGPINTFIASTKEKNLELFKRLSKMSGNDFVSTLENIATNEAFNREATQGSRRVNLFALLGAGGATGGALAGPGGAAVGATFGYLVDKYGPKATQEILDAAVKIGKNPSVDSINKLIKNDKVRKFLINELNTATRQKALER